MIRGYVAVVAGDSASADIRPNSASCKKTAVKLTTADENRFEFYINIKGTDYSFKVIGNVRTVDKDNIASGLLRIGFIVPNLDIVVSGNRRKLEAFLYALVAIKDPRVLPPMCSDSTHRDKLECKREIEKRERRDCPVASYLEGLCSFCCFQILQCYSHDVGHKILNTWKSSIKITDSTLMEDVLLIDNKIKRKLPRRCLCDFEMDNVITDPVMRVNSISANSYPYLKEIDATLSNLVDIPESLGSLPCLTKLDLSDSQLGRTMNWNWLNSPFIRENVCELILSGNELDSIPKAILGLRNLKILDLSENLLTELPTALGSLKFLRELYITGNKLVILPGWMYRKERFRTLNVWGHEFEGARDMFDIVKPQLQRNEFQNVTVPTLRKTAATYIVANSLAFWEYNIPKKIMKDLKAAYICRCGSVVFPDTTGPVVQCWIYLQALAESCDSIIFPIAIRCCSYACYKRIEFVDKNEVLL